MVLSNFRDYKELKGVSPLDTIFTAKVDCTTRRWFVGKPVTVERQVARKIGSYWAFVDTGEFCPRFAVDRLEASFSFQKRIEQFLV